MLYIFDLDGTVIDSSHRQGNGTLEDWRRLNTPKNIARDTELPLADTMRDAIQLSLTDESVRVWVCTSRIMGGADLAWLRLHYLIPNLILSRKPSQDNVPAGQFKREKLDQAIFERMVTKGKYRSLAHFKSAFSHEIWDDDKNVITALRAKGYTVSDATLSNQAIKRGIQ